MASRGDDGAWSVNESTGIRGRAVRGWGRGKKGSSGAFGCPHSHTHVWLLGYMNSPRCPERVTGFPQQPNH